VLLAGGLKPLFDGGDVGLVLADDLRTALDLLVKRLGLLGEPRLLAEGVAGKIVAALVDRQPGPVLPLGDGGLGGGRGPLRLLPRGNGPGSWPSPRRACLPSPAP